MPNDNFFLRHASLRHNTGMIPLPVREPCMRMYEMRFFCTRPCTSLPGTGLFSRSRLWGTQEGCVYHGARVGPVRAPCRMIWSFKVARAGKQSRDRFPPSQSQAGRWKPNNFLQGEGCCNFAPSPRVLLYTTHRARSTTSTGHVAWSKPYRTGHVCSLVIFSACLTALPALRICFYFLALSSRLIYNAHRERSLSRCTPRTRHGSYCLPPSVRLHSMLLPLG